ncbi:MAG TPA: hypothetical protein PLG87_02250 [Treponemataceae bacterium]|jgi:hypothetical protein|nr:hypothetical protein [Treponemataceae bacterium]
MKKLIGMLCFIILFTSSYTEDLVQEFKRKSFEPENLDPQILIKDEGNDYATDASHRVYSWIKTLDTLITDERQDAFIGTWVLKDNQKKKIDKYAMGSGPEFDIMLNSEKLYYRKQSSFSYLFFSDEGDVYIVPAFLFGVVKKLRIIENKLYLYVLTGDKWILDPIHDGGKYFYEKEELRLFDLP